MMPHTPSVSLCMITEGRPEFMEWVAFLCNRLDWPYKELVIVGSREDRESMDLIRRHLKKGTTLITDTTLEPGLTLGAKRNRALALARGDWITWADDDDWYPADRFQTTWNIMRLHRWPKGIQMLAVQSSQPVLCLENMKVMNRIKRWIWLHCWYKTELAKKIPFLELNIGEDGLWLTKFMDEAGGEEADPPVVIQHYIPAQILCLQHGRNLSCGSHSTHSQYWPDEIPFWLDSASKKEIRKLRTRLEIGYPDE